MCGASACAILFVFKYVSQSLYTSHAKYSHGLIPFHNFLESLRLPLQGILPYSAMVHVHFCSEESGLLRSMIKFAILRSRREVPWSGCRRLRLPVPFLLFCLNPAPFGSSNSLKQPFLIWGPRTTWGSMNLNGYKNCNFLFTTY
jgi:hypothetical protein